ncbi:MAG: hypothetical protein ACU836_08565 [Gammaproteobacteria bacterium]
MIDPTPKESSDDSVILQIKAKAYFAAGRYQDAASLFQQLLTQSEKTEYRHQLAQCYLQWALNVAGKGRFVEAARLWEGYAAYAEAPFSAQDRYILWLLIAKEFSEACVAVEKLTAQQLDLDYPKLSEVLGLLLLSGRTELARHLPRDGVLLKHWQVVKQALEAYYDGDAERCRQNLKNLPYRSAFRDLRILLGAQLLACNSGAAAEQQLSKIPESSPYRSMADAVAAYLKTGAGLVAGMAKLEPQHRRTLSLAGGLSADQAQLIESVSALGGWQSDKVRFDLALQYRSLFGYEAAQAFCLSLLEHYPDGFQDYLNYFGVPDAFEENRIRALLCEKAKNSYDALYYWRQCVTILQRNGPDEKPKIAKILRHMAGNVSGDEAVDLLIDSLDYDSEHRGSYLRILAFYGYDKPNSTQYDHWLERSLVRFPGDVEILANAVRSFVKRKAFKQAQAYAGELLKIDPSNRLAKQLLFDDRVRQIRHSIRTNNLELAEMQLQDAEQWAFDKDKRAQLDLMRAFFAWSTRNDSQAREQIVDALAKLEDHPVSTQFQALMESILLNQSCPLSLPIGDSLLSAPQLERLMAVIQHYDEQIADRQLLLKGMDHIKRVLEQSLERLADDENLLLLCCGVLEAVGHFDLLAYCVELAGESKQKPLWLYYQTLASCQGDVSRLDHVTLFQLQNAMSTARTENDFKTVLLIGRLIEHCQIASNPFAFSREYAKTENDAQREDLYEALFGSIPAALMEKLEQKVQDIMLEVGPEVFSEQSIRQHAKAIDPQTLSALFDDPDFFASVSLLAAADALKIDVGVRFEDVVARFEPTIP